MAKKTVNEDIVRIKKAMDEKKALLGTKETRNYLLNNEVKEVIISSNTPELVRNDLKRLASLNETQVTELKIGNDELGVVCKKPFSVSVMAIKND